MNYRLVNDVLWRGIYCNFLPLATQGKISHYPHNVVDHTKFYKNKNIKGRPHPKQKL